MPHAFNDKSRGPRLHKVLADAGVGSRRACETLIESGAVAVNGHVVDALPAWVNPIKDRITVNSRRIKPAEDPVYIMLFKPRGVVCTNDDPEGRPRAIDLVQHPARARLYAVGRLDVESSGLLLLTNDGDLANHVTHPRYGVHKVYEVTVDGTLDEAAVAKLESGVFLTNARTRRAWDTEGRPTAGRSKAGRRGSSRTGSNRPGPNRPGPNRTGPNRTGLDRPGLDRPVAGRATTRSRLTLVRSSRQRTHLIMELREGRNRQIRRMMARVGHKVRKLRRIQLGPLRLKGLRPGQWRELMPKELAALQRAAYRRDGTRAGR